MIASYSPTILSVVLSLLHQLCLHPLRRPYRQGKSGHASHRTRVGVATPIRLTWPPSLAGESVLTCCCSSSCTAALVSYTTAAETFTSCDLMRMHGRSIHHLIKLQSMLPLVQSTVVAGSTQQLV